jgi:aspartate-semialdehyde dehydrogenase
LAKAPLPFPKQQHVAIIGGDSLLAREIRELLDAEKPAPRVQLISAAAEDATVLTADDEEAVVMLPLSAQSLEGTTIAYLAGSPASSRRTLKLNSAATGRLLIDLTGSLAEQPKARLRAPSAEPKSVKPATASAIQIIAHPAAIAMTMLLTRLSAAAKIRASVVHVFEPASERGRAGIEELRKQTVGVLAFKKLDITVFDTQLAFNLLSRYGEEALEPLEVIEERVVRDTTALLSGWTAMPMPSIRLVQAPVFHGHSMSLWVEFESDVDTKQISRILTAAQIDVRPDEPPSNANIAGQSGLSVGAIHADRNNPRACWIWMVADNLRLSAENALAVAKELA